MPARNSPRVCTSVRVLAFGCAAVWLGVLALVSTTAARPRPAAASGQNAAAVVVDDGSGPRAFCVLFSADSISGLEALQATRLPVTTRAFGANGAAVCAVGGTGCGAGTDCLTCKAPNYWAYSRAATGATAFTYSMVGAASTRVTNGAVEGWLWGQGGSPAFSRFADICAQAASGGGGAGGGGGGGGGGAGGGTAAPSGGGGGGTAASSGGGGGASTPAPGDGSGSGGAAPVTSIDPVTGEVVTVIPTDAGPDAAATAGDTTSGGADPAGMTGTVVDADTTAALGTTPAEMSDATTPSGAWKLVGWIAFAVLVVGTVAAVTVLRVRRGAG